MNKGIGIAVAVAGMVALAGCNGSHSAKIKSDLSSASANPAVVAAKAKVEGCVSKEIASGTKAIINCIVPAGSGPAAEQCVTSALASDGLLTKAARVKFYQDAANCGVGSSPTPAPAGSTNGAA